MLLDVNLNKTKVLKFQQNGQVCKESFNIRDSIIECVNSYKYLGIEITSSGSFKQTKSMLYDKANRALYKLKKYIKNCDINTKLALYLFDSLIKPIMLYGSEIWGITEFTNNNGTLVKQLYNKFPTSQVEKLQLSFFKYLLGVNTKASNAAVLGELGRFPLYIDVGCNILNFLKHIGKSNNILLLDAYNLQCKMWQLGNNKCWLARVNKVLNKFDQMVDSNMFHCVNTKKFKITLQSDYISQWKRFINGNEKIVTGNKLRTYCLFKSNYIYEPYLDEIRSHSIKKELVKFRISAHKLAIESGRYLRPQVPLNDRLCTFCNDKCVENEMHFLLDCEFYKEKRESLYRIASQHCELFTFMDKIDKFIYLVSCEGPLIIEVAKFCKDAMNMRLQ